MRIKSILTVALFSITVILPVAAQTPGVSTIPETRRVAIEELLRLKKMDVNYSKMLSGQRDKIVGRMTNILNQQGASTQLQELAKKIESESVSLVDKQCSWEVVKGEVVESYAAMLTDEEIKGLVDFYRTPAGQSYADKESLLTQKMVEIWQKKLMFMLPDLQKLTAKYGPLIKAVQSETKKLGEGTVKDAPGGTEIK